MDSRWPKYLIPDLHVDGLEVAQDREVVVFMVEDHELSVAAEPAGETHFTIGNGVDGIADLDGEVDALSEGLGPELLIQHTAEAPQQGTRHGCFELAPE
jgi:hypothetical protein